MAIDRGDRMPHLQHVDGVALHRRADDLHLFSGANNAEVCQTVNAILLQIVMVLDKAVLLQQVNEGVLRNRHCALRQLSAVEFNLPPKLE